MADVAIFIAFFLACSFLYGLTAFLFRDQLKRSLLRRSPKGSSTNVVRPALTMVARSPH